MNTLQYLQSDFLGFGAYSKVYKVIINQQTFALKKIHSYILKDQQKRKQILRQIQIMKKLNHQNIVKFYQCIQNNQSQINLLLQYIDGGTLYNHLKLHDRLSEDQTKKYIKSIVSAVKYLHHNNIIHRDIKPQNILISKEGICKLADFGSSNILQEGQRTTFVGTKQYMAPEMLKSAPYGQQIDLWCIGLLTYQLLMGYLPKEENNIHIDSHISKPAEDIIKRLLHLNPHKRMTIQQLQEHIWLVGNQYDFNESIKKQNQNNKYNKQIRLLKLTDKNNLIDLKFKNKINELLEQNYSQKNKQLMNQNCYIQNKKIEKQANYYLKLINLKAKLKIQIKKQEQQIFKIIQQNKIQKFYKLQQIQRMKSKIIQYEKNIQIFQKNCLKFNYECSFLIKDFNIKVDNLYQYVEYLPQKLQQQVINLPELKTNNYKLPLNQYIFKLKKYILQCKKQAYIEILTNKKRNQIILQRRKKKILKQQQN